MSSDSLIDLMEKYKNEFYETNGKNTFFKKSQKMNCAKEISEKFDLKKLIQHTIYLIPNTNKIVYNYTVFKLFATPDNYEAVIQTVIDLYELVLKTSPTFEVHVILDSFTITAAERYKEAIRIFCNKCMTAKTKYTNMMTAMYIYFTPSMIDNISKLLKPFIDPTISDRIIMFSKAESAELIKNIHVVPEPIQEAIQEAIVETESIRSAEALS